MPSGYDLDRDALHKFLFSKCLRGGKLLLNQKELAAEFGMAPTHLCRVVQEFLEDGRLKLLGIGYRNLKTYIVRPPESETEVSSPPGAAGSVPPKSSSCSS